jgi:hypothetical protein
MANKFLKVESMESFKTAYDTAIKIILRTVAEYNSRAKCS